MYVHGIRALFRFEGYVVQKITMSSEIVQVNLRRDGRRTLRCPACDGRMNVHRTLTQTARDLPMGTAMQVVLTYPAIQGRWSGQRLHADAMQRVAVYEAYAVHRRRDWQRASFLPTGLVAADEQARIIVQNFCTFMHELPRRAICPEGPV